MFVNISEWRKRRRIKAKAKTRRLELTEEAKTTAHRLSTHGWFATSLGPWGLDDTSRRRRRTTTSRHRRSRTRV